MSFQPEGRDPLEHTSLYQRAESEESDTEGGLGNVNKLVIRPPGHSGKAKKGHLCFDASFETGNLGRVDLVSEFEYDLFIRPDTCSPRLRLWFNFTVDNVRQEQRVIFNIVNISKSKNLFREGMTPLVKSTSRPKWQRLPLTQVYYYKSAQHQNHYVLSFSFCFDREDEVYQFSLTYPYSYTRHMGHLDNLILRYPSIKRETLSNSIQKRKVELLTITTEERGTNSNGHDDYQQQHNQCQQRSRKLVVIIGRVHPGESPSSFVCQGLIDFLVSAHPIAKVLRNYVIFKVVPMLNPDGVFLGNYRSTALGMDLNRSWNRISEWIHPTLVATKALLESLDKDRNVSLDCVLDLHAHSNATGVFVYGNTYEDVYRYERHIVLPKLLAQMAEDFEQSNTMYNQDAHKEGTARRFLCSILSEPVNCYTLHVSMHGYTRKGSNDILPYTEESYYRVGRNLVRALLEYYKLTGQIPMGLPDQPTSKRARQSRHRHRAPREPRPRTARTPAPLHLTSIHEYFRTDEEEEEFAGAGSSAALEQQRSMSGGGVGSAYPHPPFRHGRTPGTRGPTTTRDPQPPLLSQQPPRLTIIDFNQLTRGGLDLATRKTNNRVKLNLDVEDRAAGPYFSRASRINK